MKGIILAGGLGTRLQPLTLVTNKHLLPVHDKPMIYYPIRCLLNAGITEIVIVTGGEHADEFHNLLCDGKHLGIGRLEYAHQAGEGGIADALMLAEDFAGGDTVCVVLGDNIIENNIAAAAREFNAQKSGARLLLKRVPDPHRFGVAQFEQDAAGQDQIHSIIEKPADPPSDKAVIGIYFYDADVFAICNRLEPSARGELEITDVNNYYIARGDLTWSELDGWWTDAGTHDSLCRATRLVAEGGANHAPNTAEREIGG
jgi:glucose-1-phosphate thymidylyltransferase